MKNLCKICSNELNKHLFCVSCGTTHFECDFCNAIMDVTNNPDEILCNKCKFVRELLTEHPDGIFLVQLKSDCYYLYKLPFYDVQTENVAVYFVEKSEFDIYEEFQDYFVKLDGDLFSRENNRLLDLRLLTRLLTYKI